MYFNERLAFLNVNIFYQLFKNRATYSEIDNVRQQLIKEQLIYILKTTFSKLHWAPP